MKKFYYGIRVFKYLEGFFFYAVQSDLIVIFLIFERNIGGYGPFIWIVYIRRRSKPIPISVARKIFNGFDVAPRHRKVKAATGRNKIFSSSSIIKIKKTHIRYHQSCEKYEIGNKFPVDFLPQAPQEKARDEREYYRPGYGSNSPEQSDPYAGGRLFRAFD